MNIFGDEADFELFMALLKRATKRHAVSVHAFTLMTNHYHLIVTPADSRGLAKAMQSVNGKYVNYFNRRYERIGTLFNGRFQAIGLHDRVYWLTCLRYVELNPVAAQIADRPDSYRWSSYCFHAYGQGPAWLASHAFFDSVGSTPAARQSVYRDMCRSLLTPAEVALQKFSR